jgi:hypothetical protein
MTVRSTVTSTYTFVMDTPAEYQIMEQRIQNLITNPEPGWTVSFTSKVPGARRLVVATTQVNTAEV